MDGNSTLPENVVTTASYALHDMQPLTMAANSLWSFLEALLRAF